ncbi:DegT/DnrJ/EryC1/StrS family aminotransferase [Paenibacillus sp.]|uniref:DegT/DnrJ/EryC1/StrS family aminotransferase n=1 Tax=Paenibacillus sp. TaxID=58172 RepID=UPI002811BE9E|nr:DegT/DnrJ/EryC1/StrS family aminotransferase [Paenibacillus sp.]
MPGPGAYLIGEEEKKELMDVIESGHFFRYGAENDPKFQKKVVQFEKEFANYTETKYALAVSSGTGALMSCLAALNIGPDDEVIVPGYTFIASISSIILSGAIPVLAEIDESLTIDPDDIRRKITKRTKAIMPVHMLGNPCDMDRIMEIAREFRLFVIEDCCQAAGAAYKWRKVGSIGHMGAFSLNNFKTITSGDGGMVITNDEFYYERAFGFHDQGHKPNRTGVEVGNRSIIGMNMRMNELTGAVALAQTRKLDMILAALREKKAKMKLELQNTPGFQFRKINDPMECATLLTLLFDSKEIADRFAERIGTKTLAHSGWHVYNNMEQLLAKKYEFNNGEVMEYRKHMLPKTDGILERAINISIGVVDSGLGAGYGINIHSSDQDIQAVADNIKKTINEILA